jgi:hypothetical protein
MFGKLFMLKGRDNVYPDNETINTFIFGGGYDKRVTDIDQKVSAMLSSSGTKTLHTECISRKGIQPNHKKIGTTANETDHI